MAALRNEHEALEQYRIQDAPLSMFYIPNFITLEEEEYILNKVRLPPILNSFQRMTDRNL